MNNYLEWSKEYRAEADKMPVSYTQDVYKRQAIILCAVVIRNDGGDIFICPCGRSAVIQRNGIVGGGIGSFCRYGKTAAAI